MNNEPERILILGASGMLGSTLVRYFSNIGTYAVVGSVRSKNSAQALPPPIRDCIVTGIDVERADDLHRLFTEARPNVVINCVGLVKQRSHAEDPLEAIPINALLPHRLARLCTLVEARFVHVSTDCVFSGAASMYKESDLCDARDVYGRSKLLGEVDYPHTITLRTSIIGHELQGAQGLLNWFLAQTGPTVPGYPHAFFSGLPTVELARVIHKYILPRPDLRGLYHVSTARISKFDLLELLARAYGKNVSITANPDVKIDRSLDSRRFREATGYVPPDWPSLVRAMRAFQ